MKFSNLTTEYIKYQTSSKINTAITEYDIKAFEWIKENTDQDAIFFVNPEGGGAYIYIFTGRITFPLNAMRLWYENESVKNDFTLIYSMLIRGSLNESLVELLKKYNIQYIYVGAKVQYNKPRFNLSALLNSNFLILVFSLNEQVFIFKFTA